MPFVSSSIYDKAIRLMQREGLSPEYIKQYKNQKAIAEGSKYIPMELLLEAYELADQHLKDGFSIRQGKQLNADDYGTLGLSWKTCWQAKDILVRTKRFMVLVTDHGKARVEENEDRIKFVMEREPSSKGIEMANEAAFVMISGIIKEVTGKSIQPEEVQFQHVHGVSDLFRAYFQCPVHFARQENSIQYSIRDVDIPTLKADRSIQQFLIERMEEEKQGIQEKADSLLNNINQLIEETLPSGIPSMAQVAKYVGLSSRTLRTVASITVDFDLFLLFYPSLEERLHSLLCAQPSASAKFNNPPAIPPGGQVTASKPDTYFCDDPKQAISG